LEASNYFSGDGARRARSCSGRPISGSHEPELLNNARQLQ
jgi:hypothetical protein